VPYLNGPDVEENVKNEDRQTEKNRGSGSGNRRRRSNPFQLVRLTSVRPTLRGSAKGSIWDLRKSEGVELVANEERFIFINALRAAYHYLIEKGEVESRGFLPYSLFRSIDYAQDKAARGQPLADWEALCVASDSFASHATMILLRVNRMFKSKAISLTDFYKEVEHSQMLFLVQEILAFIKAHEIAEKVFKDISQGDGKDELSRAENVVLQESLNQVLRAEQALSEFDENKVQQIKSHYACHIILNKAAAFYEKLSLQGLMTEREAGEFLEEVESSIRHLNECQVPVHNGELSERHKMERMPNDEWSSLHLRSIDVKIMEGNVTKNADEV
jgi:hypothetical protein